MGHSGQVLKYDFILKPIIDSRAYEARCETDRLFFFALRFRRRVSHSEYRYG